MFSSHIFTKILLLFILIVQVLFGKPQIYAINKNNVRVPYNGLVEYEGSKEINDIEYFIVGDENDEDNDENPLVFISPIRTAAIVKIILNAMQDFMGKKVNSKFYGKLILSNWAVIGQDDLCEDKNKPGNCPSLILQGTTSFSYRYNRKEVISLNQFFVDYIATNNYTLFSTKFIKQVEYDYSIDGEYVAVPLITDMRVLYFNIDTYDKVGLQYPPPLGNSEWTWERLVKDVEAIDQYYETHNIEGNPFAFFGLYDEEMKLFSAILRNYGVPTISSSESCGYCSSKRNFGRTVQAINEVVKPLFNIMKKHNLKWCNYTKNDEVEKWLNKEYSSNSSKNYYIKLEDNPIECPMDKPKDFTTDGLIFCSPPSMASETIVTTSAQLSTRTTNLGIAYMPGTFSFLGGSGLMISSKVSKESQQRAWEFILTLIQESNYLNDINIESKVPPPYDYILDNNRDNIWNNDDWSVYVQQLRKSLPISYPRGNTKNFNKLEMYHPVRLMFFDILKRGTDVSVAVNQTCETINYYLEEECTTSNFLITTPLCKRGKLLIDMQKSGNCHDGIEKIDSSRLSFQCPYENYDSLFGLTILIMILIGITFNVLYISLFTAYRKGDPIRKASYWFSVFIVAGCILMQLSLLLYLGSPKERLCYIRLWFFIIGFGFSLGGLVVKAYRIYSIFNNRDLKPLVITDGQLFKKFFIIMVIEIGLLSLWTYNYVSSDDTIQIATRKETPYDSLKKDINSDIGDIEYKYSYCKSFSSTSTIIFIYVFNFILIIFGCFYSIKTWSIPQTYSETKFVACSIFMMSFVVSVCVPSLSIIPESNVNIHFIIISLATFFTCFLATGVYSIPKIYNSYWYYQQEYYRQGQGSNDSLDYSTNNGDIKIMRENSDSLINEYNNRKINRNRLYGGGYGMNETLNRAAAIGNTLIDHDMLGGNHSKYSNNNHQFSMLNSSELNSSSVYHKRISRCRIINNELHCPDCGCVFEVMD